MKLFQEQFSKKSKNKEKGFSYIDVMISITIFMVGILAMTGALLSNRMRSQIIENQLVAKQMALSSLESILAAKELNPSSEISGWDTVGNVGSNEVKNVNRGVFEIDFRPVRQGPGEDGIIGTIDDACVGTGGCGVNNSPIVTGFERKVEITDVPSVDYTTIRQRDIKITIRYQANGRSLEESIKTIVTDYR
jgi:type II secretory pathway pseudopilin PulG